MSENENVNEEFASTFGWSMIIRKNFLLGAFLLLVSAIVTLGALLLSERNKRDADVKFYISVVSECNQARREDVERLKNDYIYLLKQLANLSQKTKKK